ncbi:methylated-DNA--[protein]-cysteine S-methyltransferase [Tetragenococcus koreensis]|uniref:Methylated-DNA--protein-cysteine methyltransferase n=2 Tax=Tetragenococcus koreensis TaxID=290335 RepID=A0AAN4UAI1_9ENTE|nr:methylated-DNA--[protein]-cysteine S-methyltransferase [Tetragenococcus koreensis]MDN5810566.1 methylated-DNA--[protein]-cysteine S-methyltransferase [Tetragenococcus koreensis]MDN6165211.1 methylated-DNA--[protein]-cysteine S-methyltransferase [Tetragenococcus koreensis]MDN6269077.1 methylated-DNA--[protein]-cysteine S-methyltransferase [Tetragenococcus koreensis]MDN6344790.1 methylated-DNA--[protein]-cysteine S-methyltransferase [Tetragenococcus koreensis]MDN6471249.1 methylated-DNA--[pro
MIYMNKTDSPLGPLVLTSDGENLTGLWFENRSTIQESWQEKELPIFTETQSWLQEYFTGKDPAWMLPVKPEGTDYRKNVWKALLEVPYGETASYKDIAQMVDAASPDRKTSARAVGGAVGKNPISIIIPCHRIIGSDGDLTGYGGGIDRKIKLLELEKSL